MNAQRIVLLSVCTLFASIISPMDQKKQDYQALPDCRPIVAQLQQDYTHYLRNRMTEYKKIDIDFAGLYNMGKTMTGINNNNSIITIKDEDGNYFVHVATQKRDLKNLTYLYDRCACKADWAENNDKKTPFDICIKQLAPTAPNNEEQSKVTSLAILNATMRHMEKLSKQNHWATYRKNCIQKIINLELAYKQSPWSFNFTIDQELLISLLPSAPFGEQQLSLATFYQEATCEPDGHTFTHLFLKRGDSDGLFEWINKGRVSFLKNKADQNPLVCALTCFQYYTHTVARIESDPEGFQKTRCCLFILLNYCKLQSKSGEPLLFCCDKHTFSK